MLVVIEALKWLKKENETIKTQIKENHFLTLWLWLSKWIST